MSFIRNTFFLQTFKVKGYLVATVVLAFILLSGFSTFQLFMKIENEESNEEIVHKNGEEYHPMKVYTFEQPDEAVFAGEPAPLHLYDVWERMDYELHLNVYFHSNTIALIKRSHRWLPEIARILKRFSIPDDFKYLPLIESGLQNVVSPREAVGFWQLREGTAKELGLEVTKEVDERYDPAKSTEAACRYLLKAYEKFGSWTLAAAAYNMGINGLSERLKEQQVNSYYDLLLNEETARYVYRLIAVKEILNRPAIYGYDIPRSHMYRKIPSRVVIVEEDLKDLAKFANEQGINYKILKKFNPWLRTRELTVKKDKSYEIMIPRNVKAFMTAPSS